MTDHLVEPFPQIKMSAGIGRHAAYACRELFPTPDAIERNEDVDYAIKRQNTVLTRMVKNGGSPRRRRARPPREIRPESGGLG